jgi:hypothetical protein
MRITGSDITMASTAVKASSQTRTVKVTAPERPDDRPAAPAPARKNVTPPAVKPGVVSDQFDLSEPGVVTCGAQDASEDMMAVTDPRLQRLMYLLEKLFGMKVSVPENCGHRGHGRPVDMPAPAQQPDRPRPRHRDAGVIIERTVVREEHEQVQFQAQGKVKTQCGQEIDFCVQLDMHRDFVQRTDERLVVGDDGVARPMKDPLVLNVDGMAARLQDATMQFDITADGQVERVHVLDGSSAYLAFDRNNNGIIDDGSELFGAVTGDGFAELAAYDADGNGWIDDADPIMARLLLWRPSAEGPGTLQTAAAAGVGAIFTGSAGTQFTLTPGSEKDAYGQVRSTGVFLREGGGAGTVQQVDLTV